MTVFLASLFLPKTIYFNLPDSPARNGRRAPRPNNHGASNRISLNTRPSLFTPNPANTPPLTPTEDKSPIDDHLFLNEDSLPVHTSNDAEFRGPADKQSPSWGGRTFRPSSRANSPPPASILEHDKTLQKAKELARQGIFQPRASRSDSHDRVFANANWRIVNTDQGNGGLRNAAEAAARDGYDGEFTWVGTLGMPTDALEGTQQKQDICDRLTTEYNMLPVFCLDKDFDGHYLHFCKQILWPVFHYQIPDNPKSKAYEDHSWKFYVNINQAFADKIVKDWKRGDTIWIHDYHLLLLPGMIRKKLPEAKIGLFLHVAFPSSEVFRCLAVRKELLEGMLGANLIGFQIAEYTRHFLQTCSRLLSVETTNEGIQLEDRLVDVTHTAIGIDPVNLNVHRQDPEVMKWVNIMRDRYKDKKIIVARDKLDVLRGVRQKLLAFELFLNKNPSWRDQIVLIQVALSTSENSEKTGLDAAVGEIVARINSAWANLAYQPVVYLKQDIPYPQYLALLTIADALMITSQREGMNLTSHEFIVCQDGAHCDQKHGSLILSEFTGTSSLFGRQELSVNPWSYRQCSDAIKQAIEMSNEEKASRWSSLREVVSRQTGSHWFTSFLSQLDQSYEVQHRQDQISIPRLNLNRLCKQYLQSERRLFLLDYEGTLTPDESMKDIAPANPQRTLSVLNDLVYDNRNTVFVMSARRSDELDRLFRLVPNLGLIAENGCFIKYPGESSWIEFADRDKVAAWKQSVRNTLHYYLERTPGSEIEERSCSLIFHFKNAEDFTMAERQASDWTAHINESCEDQHVHATQLEDCVVVEPSDWTKDSAASHIFERLKANEDGGNHNNPPDFLMVVGDGREDEKVFRWANKLQEDGDVKEAVTVTLSCRNTEAKTTLTQAVSGVLVTLQKLASLS
ncbi:family 20 glycosyltransferase [Hypoxylon argillaceum]|nr:family 20 glycosyltransferase [Hypoxylon argillaceum]